MNELALSQEMEAELLQGINNPISRDRFSVINNAANSSSNTEVESEKIQVAVSQAVKNLEEETKEMFPEKTNVAEAVLETDKKVDEKEDKVEKTESKKILGMKPLTFVVVSAASVGLGIYLYKKFVK